MYKKNKGKNFVEDERKLLLDLVVPYKEIVENVKVKFYYIFILLLLLIFSLYLLKGFKF